MPDWWINIINDINRCDQKNSTQEDDYSTLTPMVEKLQWTWRGLLPWSLSMHLFGCDNSKPGWICCSRSGMELSMCLESPGFNLVQLHPFWGQDQRWACRLASLDPAEIKLPGGRSLSGTSDFWQCRFWKLNEVPRWIIAIFVFLVIELLACFCEPIGMPAFGEQVNPVNPVNPSHSQSWKWTCFVKPSCSKHWPFAGAIFFALSAQSGEQSGEEIPDLPKPGATLGACNIFGPF